MPRFEYASENGWNIRIYKTLYERMDEWGRVTQIKLSDLLRLPEEKLVMRDGLWRRAQEQCPLIHWQAFDRTVLHAWREDNSLL